MPELPAITHVALTVSDLNRSVPWYQALIGSNTVIDEDTVPFRRVVWMVGNHRLSPCTSSRTRRVTNPSMSCDPGWTTWPSIARTGANWERLGRRIERVGYQARRDRGRSLRLWSVVP